MKRKISHSPTADTNTLRSHLYTTRDISSIIDPIKYFLKRFISHSSESNTFTDSSSRKKRNMKKYLPLALLLVIVGGVILVAGRMVTASGRQTADQRATIKGPTASVTLNKEFSFPLNDSKGKELTRLKYTIESAELRDEIIVKGSRATSVNGRTFLIVNMKFVNSYDKAIDLKARDYLRLSVNGNENELMAADIHNDPVNLQPISTKLTRLGFPINETDTNLVLKVGEIKGEKESVPLNF